ncbi:MAG: DUF222 domain-containing protein [Mycobacteriales bacterium]
MFDSELSPPAQQQRAASARLARVLAGAAETLGSARVLRLRPLEPPRVVLARIAGLAPSAQSLAALHAIDVSSLDAHDRVSWLTSWERHRGWFDAQAQAGIVAVGGASPPPAAPGRFDSDRDDVGREHVALALRLSSATGGARLDVARELTGRLPRTLGALERGELTYWHAKAVADAVATLDDAAAVAVERITAEGAPSFETLTSFRHRVARAVLAADPQTADEQHLAAVGGRRVLMWAEPHGMATMQATLTADEAATALRALTALARRSRADGDDRPIDVLRADAFTAVFTAALADPGLPAEQRMRPRVGMTLDSATLFGLADHPGHLDGYGPIPPVMARRLAAGGDWHRLVTDPVSGALLDYGRTTYRPDAELAEFITARDRTCRFPTCARAARHCDIDHAQPYQHPQPDEPRGDGDVHGDHAQPCDPTSHGDRHGGCGGGATSSANCGALCRRNHRQKTAGDVHLVSHPDGSATWTTSTGHTYHRPAVDHCPEHTAHLRALREQAALDDAHADADAAERDGEQADARWDHPDWIDAHTAAHGLNSSDTTGNGPDWAAWHTGDDDHTGPTENDTTQPTNTADQSAAAAHDTSAGESSNTVPLPDTSSGNDPPPC